MMRLLFTLGFLFTPVSEGELVNQISLSGRCATVGETPDHRVSHDLQVAPGQAPLLSFRTYESRKHGRFSNSDLMLDDAGH